jgi:hypothetical protein
LGGTRVNADVEQIAATSTRAPGSAVTFGFDGGSTTIGQAAVTIGKFLQYEEHQRYFVVLYATKRQSEQLIPSVAFRINSDGVLEYMRSNRGETVPFATNFVGRNVTDVMEAFAGVR